jgi:hypothetical protein
MIALYEFAVEDKYYTDHRKLMRIALDAANREGEYMGFDARCVAIKHRMAYIKDGVNWQRYVFVVYGHEVEVPEEFKHWTERLQNMVGMLTIGDAWAGE